jgi:hypothetical protein
MGSKHLTVAPTSTKLVGDIANHSYALVVSTRPYLLAICLSFLNVITTFSFNYRSLFCMP